MHSGVGHGQEVVPCCSKRERDQTPTPELSCLHVKHSPILQRVCYPPLLHRRCGTVGMEGRLESADGVLVGCCGTVGHMLIAT